jgi:hypothetical protein
MCIVSMVYVVTIIVIMVNIAEILLLLWLLWLLLAVIVQLYMPVHIPANLLKVKSCACADVLYISTLKLNPRMRVLANCVLWRGGEGALPVGLLRLLPQFSSGASVFFLFGGVGLNPH